MLLWIISWLLSHENTITRVCFMAFVYISFHGSLCEIISVTLAVVCNRASSIFGDALLKVVQNLYCNVSMMLWSPSLLYYQLCYFYTFLAWWRWSQHHWNIAIKILNNFWAVHVWISSWYENIHSWNYFWCHSLITRNTHPFTFLEPQIKLHDFILPHNYAHYV